MSMIEEEPASAGSSTYQWLCANPLASSCGSTVASFYNASRDYNSLTVWSFGLVEGVAGYAANKVAPLSNVISNSQREYVDSAVSKRLAMLEESYPILSKEPNEISSASKKAVQDMVESFNERLYISTGREYLSSGLDSLSWMMELLINKILPVSDLDEINEKIDQSSRLKKLTSSIYHRSLIKFAVLHQQLKDLLLSLRNNVKLLEYYQAVCSGVKAGTESASSAVKTAEENIYLYIFNGRFDSMIDRWFSSEKDNENFKSFLKDNDKGLFNAALEYCKSSVQSLLNKLEYFNTLAKRAKMNVQLPSGIVDQVKEVYSSLSLNNVPAELPSFLLSQLREVVETQLLFIEKSAAYITSLIKQRFANPITNDEDRHESVSEVSLEEEEEEEEEGN